MKLLSTYQVAEITGLPYAKALILIKAMNHLQVWIDTWLEVCIEPNVSPTTLSRYQGLICTFWLFLSICNRCNLFPSALPSTGRR